MPGSRTAGVESRNRCNSVPTRTPARTWAGKLEELKQAYEEANAEVLIVDDETERRSEGTGERADRTSSTGRS